MKLQTNVKAESANCSIYKLDFKTFVYKSSNAKKKKNHQINFYLLIITTQCRGWDGKGKMSVNVFSMFNGCHKSNLPMNFLEQIHANLWAYCHFHTCSQEQNDKECYAGTSEFRAQNTWLTIVKALSKNWQIFSK